MLELREARVKEILDEAKAFEEEHLEIPALARDWLKMWEFILGIADAHNCRCDGKDNGCVCHDARALLGGDK